MNFSRKRYLILSFAFLASAVYAVEQLPEKEEDIPVEFIPDLNTSVSVGLHRLNSGPRVHFGNLGSMGINEPDSTDYKYSKTYDNGKVVQDALLGYEVDRNGNQMLVQGQTRTTPGWISVVSVAPNGVDRAITVYTPVESALLGADGKPLVYKPDGTPYYLPATNPVVTTNPDGSKTISDVIQTVWGSTNRYLGYNADHARTWSIQNASQADFSTHKVTMDSYGASTMGESKTTNAGPSTGVELTMERTMGKIGKLEWGFAGELQIQQINAKSAGTVWAHFLDRKDVYDMVPTYYNSDFYATGTKADPNTNVTTAVTFGLTQPTGNTQSLPMLTQDGRQVYQYVGSITAPYTYAAGGDQSIQIPLNVATMNATLYDGQTGDTVIDATGQTLHHQGYLGEVLVHGFWQLKGAYYLMNIGPSFRYRFNDTWAVSGKVAFSVAYIGLTFRADEEFSNVNDVYLYSKAAFVPLVDDTTTNEKIYVAKEQNSTHRFLGGFYGEINGEYWVTERTGFYAGATFQSIRSMGASPLNKRTATIDLGENTGWHIGIITRF